MAIYHFSAKIISRTTGRSAVAAAAYRAAEALHDERLDRTHDFTAKAGVVNSEIVLPASAPERLTDRATLWNEVERGDERKDAQLAREIEYAIPRELTKADGITLARAFVAEQFVARGMVRVGSYAGILHALRLAPGRVSVAGDREARRVTVQVCMLGNQPALIGL